MNTSEKEVKKFLVLTGLTGFQDFSQPAIYLADWCLSWPEKTSTTTCDKKIFTDPLLKKINSLHGYHYTLKIYNSLLPKIAQWLNNTHNTTHSLTYWKIVIGPFLLQYIQTVYHRMMYLKKAHSQYENLQTIGLPPASFITPTDTQHFIGLADKSDGWNHQLLTQIWNLMFQPISRYQPYSWDAELKFNNTKLPLTNKKIRKKITIRLITFFISKFGRKITALYCTDIIFCNKLNLLKMLFLTKFRALPVFELPDVNNFSEKNNVIKRELRKELSSFENISRFSKLILKTLEINLPLIFLEKYREIDNNVQACFPYKPAALFGLGWIDNDRMKLWAAKLSEQGSKLIALQHGGCYGHHQFTTYEYMERANTDLFISWGWTDNQKKTIPAPSFFISKQIKKAKKNPHHIRNLILWAATEPETEYLTFFGSAPMMNLYLQSQEKFLQSLANNVLIELLFRPRPNQQWHKYLQHRHKSLKIDNDSRKEVFYDRLKNTKILVVDNLNTTFLYGLALNIPTIIFWEKDSWLIRDEAKPYFDLLQQAKIYHDSPESAAKMLNEIFSDPTIWWNSQMVQSAREQFCNNYILTSNTPLRDWAKILIQMQSA